MTGYVVPAEIYIHRNRNVQKGDVQGETEMYGMRMAASRGIGSVRGVDGYVTHGKEPATTVKRRRMGGSST